LDFLRRALLGEFENVIVRDDAEHDAVVVDHRQRDAVVFLERGDDCLPPLAVGESTTIGRSSMSASLVLRIGEHDEPRRTSFQKFPRGSTT
jgi:hypothetical protein